MRIRWPADAWPTPSGGWPMVLFLHGLGGTRAKGEVWGRAWAAAGLVVLHLQHPRSDLDAARKVASSFSDCAALRGMSSAQQLLARLQGVVFVLDEVARRHTGDACGLPCSQSVLAALPAGNKAQLVLRDADHMSFGGQTGRVAGILLREAVAQQLQTQHHALVASITTDWWRAYLTGDATAKARLVQPQGLAAQDTWQTAQCFR